jgi:tol-pal system protein YbgF
MAAAISVAGCSAFGPREDDPTQLKLAELEQRVARLERTSGDGMVELQRQLDAAQAELRALRGGLEETQHGLEGARKQQRDLYGDLDQRLQAVEKAAVASSVPAPGAAGTTDEVAYQAALELLKAGKYDEAEAAFEAFLRERPGSELGDNARYWLGETRYAQRDFAGAEKTFAELVKGSPDARKVPDAMLKLGYCQYEQKRYDAARTTLNKVIKQYPDTSAAREARDRLKRMAAEGR